MEKNVSLDISKTWKFVSEEELSNLKSTAELAKETLVKGTGAGSDDQGREYRMANSDNQWKGHAKRSGRCKLQSSVDD